MNLKGRSYIHLKINIYFETHLFYLLSIYQKPADGEEKKISQRSEVNYMRASRSFGWDVINNKYAFPSRVILLRYQEIKTSHAR